MPVEFTEFSGLSTTHQHSGRAACPSDHVGMQSCPSVHREGSPVTGMCFPCCLCGLLSQLRTFSSVSTSDRGHSCFLVACPTERVREDTPFSAGNNRLALHPSSTKLWRKDCPAWCLAVADFAVSAPTVTFYVFDFKTRASTLADIARTCGAEVRLLPVGFSCRIPR